jgi:hypothetical protein
MKTHTLAELETQRRRRTQYGRWRFDEERLVLVDTGANGYGYEIDLEKCTTSAAVLDWIAQMRTKTWINTEDIGDLVEAFDRLIGLQSTLCGFGHECGPIDVAAVIRNRRTR